MQKPLKNASTKVINFSTFSGLKKIHIAKSKYTIND
jgi:hypothetical protein